MRDCSCGTKPIADKTRGFRRIICPDCGARTRAHGTTESAIMAWDAHELAPSCEANNIAYMMGVR